MKIRTNRLKDKALDWAVAKCEGYECEFGDEVSGPWLVPREGYLHDERPLAGFRPSTNPAQGQPIIEAAKISVIWVGEWCAYGSDTPEGDRNPDGYGETALIAAMRCRVVLKMGQEIEIPEELIRWIPP